MLFLLPDSKGNLQVYINRKQSSMSWCVNSMMARNGMKLATRGPVFLLLYATSQSLALSLTFERFNFKKGNLSNMKPFMWSVLEIQRTSLNATRAQRGLLLCIPVYCPLWYQPKYRQGENSQCWSGELWDWKEAGRCPGGESVVQNQVSWQESKSPPSHRSVTGY